MIHKQDNVQRQCQICMADIQPGEIMLDLFRQESAREGPTVKQCWVHEKCAISAIETWLRKKWSKITPVPTE